MTYKINEGLFNSKILNESNIDIIYNIKGGNKMTYKLSKIAEGMDISNSNRFRNEIVEEYKEVLESLDSIDKSIINKNIEMLPVYKINEEVDDKNIKQPIEPVNEALSTDYDFVMSYNINFVQRKLYPLWALKKTRDSFNKRLVKYETQLKDFKKMSEEEKEKLCFKINAANSAYSAGMAVATTAASSYASNGQYSLTYIEIPSKITPFNYESVVSRMIKKMKYDINKLEDIIDKKEKAKGLKESYAIDLDSLKYVVESEHCTLEEAVQKIKDANYIDDSYNISCVLSEGFNEQMTLDQFITLHNVLTEAGINLIWTKEISENEFINEDLNDYGIYLKTGNINYLDYKTRYPMYTPSDKIPSFVDIKHIEDVAFKYTNNINLKNINKNRDYPFKLFRRLSISQDELIRLVNDTNKNTNIFKKLNSKVYQYNFTKKNKKISLLIITTNNEVENVYIILDSNNKLIELKI